MPRETRYMTLSHRWGQAEFLNLTKSTRNALEAGIVPLSHVPKTFADAISVARRLNVRYIWIDSLCIQQDSLDDWQKESIKMRHVYANAYCNIAAADALDANSGLFFDRDVASVLLCVHENISTKIEYIVFNADFWVDNVERGPLASRAWVVQERMLAKHTLYFGKEQVFWECAQLTASETCPEELLSTIFGIRQPTMKVGNPLFSITDSETPMVSPRPCQPALDNLMAFWRRMVNAYARCELTKPNDKLVAIAGIASQLEPRIKHTYHEGLWGYNMVSELMWSVSGCRQANGEPSVRPPGRKAPTWSWASIDGLVRCNDIDFENYTNACPVAKVERVWEDSRCYWRYNRDSTRVKVRGNLVQAAVLLSNRGDRQYKLMLGDECSVFFFPDVPLDETLDVCLCLPLGHYFWPDSPEAPVVEGLVLQRSEVEERLYSRLGIFRAASKKTCQALGIEFSKGEVLGRPLRDSFQQVLTLN
jgi:hypothetical protein